ncbi:unnamed protein product [Phytophthora lilii]|uniref:Unnamed protein product n=1 Tax=Phytophthora lilii TaxID=2077276 RepID=A0A9W7CSD7_9STRA|nr:unnamed protein product [Phytophthora lilii]
MLGFLATAVLIGDHSASQASKFDVGLTTAGSFQCGQAFYNTLKTTNAADLSTVGIDFDWDFYAIASNFSTAKPGDLLKFKPVDPTNLKNISGVSVWSLLTERGYAIVGTDYGGLGTNGTDHKYKDLHHSVTAARQAFGSVLSTEWMSVGHSQGGGAVWKLAEDVNSIAESSARIVPNSSSSNLGPTLHDSSAASLLPVLDKALKCVKSVLPNYTSSCTDGGSNGPCASGMLGLTLDLDIANMMSLTTGGPTAADIAIAQEFQDITSPANGSIAHGPILVVRGVNDTAILAETTEQAWQRAGATVARCI